jgi:diadenosine tetraphosphate (Ap4A) HIT family hydrolase
MTIVPEHEWPKLDLANINGWRLSVAANQHLLGWLIIFPPREIETSIVHLTDAEFAIFKRIGLLAEELLIKTFNTEWFNYLQEGNGERKLHIHLHPRYSSPREFEGFTFTDQGWGRKVKFLNEDKLPPKEIVFKVADKLRDSLRTMDLKDSAMKVTIVN